MNGKTDTNNVPNVLAQKRAFLKLPMEERRRILQQQAERVAEEYNREGVMEDMQGGDIVEDY